ncbi:MAG: hypothetical protein K2X55_18175 [Burkholderiaceae bacterium]|nr:hypothetical protein [Burkholderiaceae bacterium]
MKLPTIVQKTAALCLLLGSTVANATVLTFAMPHGYSLESQHGCLVDAACLLQTDQPIAPALGQLADQALMPVSANDLSYINSRFSTNGMGEDVFLSLARIPTKTAAGASTDDDSDELMLMKKLIRGLRQTYASINAMVALPDNSQGNGRDANDTLAALCNEGISIGCDTGAFAPVLNNVCVGSDGSYNSFGAASQAACPAGSVHVRYQRGTGKAEYAAYAQSLKNFAKETTISYSMPSFEGRSPRNEASTKRHRYCDDCNLEQPQESEPGLLRKMLNWLKDPLALILLGIGLVAVLCADTLLRARRS